MKRHCLNCGKSFTCGGECEALHGKSLTDTNARCWCPKCALVDITQYPSDIINVCPRFTPDVMKPVKVIFT